MASRVIGCGLLLVTTLSLFYSRSNQLAGWRAPLTLFLMHRYNPYDLPKARSHLAATAVLSLVTVVQLPRLLVYVLRPFSNFPVPLS
jgi:hypothetical protein